MLNTITHLLQSMNRLGELTSACDVLVGAAFVVCEHSTSTVVIVKDTSQI